MCDTRKPPTVPLYQRMDGMEMKRRTTISRTFISHGLVPGERTTRPGIAG